MAGIVYAESGMIADNVKRICKEYGIGRDKLAKIMGISKSALYWRMNSPDNIRIGELERFADWMTRHKRPMSLLEVIGLPFPAVKIKAEVNHD